MDGRRAEEALSLAQVVARRTAGADLAGRAGRYAEPGRLSGSPAEAAVVSRLGDDLRAAGWSVREGRVRALTSRPGRALVRVGGTIYPGVAAAFSGPASDRRGPAAAADRLPPAAWAGRVVVARTSLPTPALVASAQAAGAAALVCALADAGPRMLSVSPVQGSPTPWTVGNLTDLPVVVLAGEVAEAFAARVAEAGAEEGRGPTVSVTSGVDTRWRDVPVLAADLPAAAAEEAGFVLLGGHTDAWYAGAMDNAAGLAAMAEVAAALKPEAARLRRAVRLVAWSGGEDGGHAGAQAYADAHWEELEGRCGLFLEVDSPGGRGNVDLGRLPAMAETGFLARAAVEQVARQAWTGSRPGGGAARSLWAAGVPSALGRFGQPPGTEATSPGLRHTPGDTVDALDGEVLARDAALLGHMAAHAAALTVEPVDLAAGARAMEAAVAAWEERAQGRVELALCRRRAADLTAACEELMAAAQAAPAPALARAARAVAHRLVRLGYTAGGRFEPDPALPLAPLPTLSAVEALVAAPPLSAPADLAMVAVERAVTAVAVTLREAREVAEGALASLAGGPGRRR